MIYFIQCGTNGPIKIGQTDNDIQSRIAQLQTGCPYELKLLWVYTGTDYTETQIHAELENERVRGEWFHPSDSVLAFIRSELTNYYEIITQNGRHVDLAESIDSQDTISIKTGINRGIKYHDIYHHYKDGSIKISTATNNGTPIELTRIR